MHVEGGHGGLGGGEFAEGGFGGPWIRAEFEDATQEALAAEVSVQDSVEIGEGDLEMPGGLLLGPALFFQMVFSCLWVHIETIMRLLKLSASQNAQF